MKTIEILCPAGDFDAVKAAVLNGANAVYVGGMQFSARQNATNFSHEQLAEAVSYCHVRGVKLYLALNTLVFDNQLDQVVTAIKNACEISIDALIVQDLGILSLVKKYAPLMPVHASTQMAVHTKNGAQLLLNYGVKRVVLARELTLAEIAEICTLPIEVEVFVHGALCMSVSGQCYISGMIGTRSGNRGNCAGTCRLPFALPNSNTDYNLSLKENCLVSHIKELQEIGVASLKIEGRMKRPEYVAAAAEVYSNSVNGLPYDLETLRAVFSRNGFTDAYLTNKIDADMFGYRGKQDVISATNKILKQLENTYKKEIPLIPLDMCLSVPNGKEVTLTATDCDGNVATTTAAPAEVAINSPMTLESASRSLGKLGSTPFLLRKLTADIDDGLILPASSLNELRRAVCDEIISVRGQLKSIPIVEQVTHADDKRFPVERSTIRARFRTFEQITHMDQFEYIILPLVEVSKNRLALSKLKNKIIIEPNRVMFNNEQNTITKLHSLYEEGYRHLLCDNLAHIQIGKDLGFILHAGAYLNCVNTEAVKTLQEYGVTDITLSFEGELSRLNSIKSAVPLGLISYGYLPLMIMKSCPIKAHLPSNQTCKDCGGNKSLTDRMGISFPVICNLRQYAEVLNSSKLYMADRQHELRFSFQTLYFTVETKEECDAVIADYSSSAPAKGQFTRGLYYRSI